MRSFNLRGVVNNLTGKSFQRRHIMQKRMFSTGGRGVLIGLALIIMAMILMNVSPVLAADDVEAQGIVDKCRVTFSGFMNDKNYSWLQDNFKKAKGVLIFPQVLKAGFFLGGSGGTGVLLVKDKSGAWSQPAFYTLGSVTFGFQIGGEAAEVVMMVMSQKAVDSLYASSVKLGGDTSIALGPVGAGATGNVTADFISFAKTKGLYAGLNLQGSVLAVRDKLNHAYYHKTVSPIGIMVEKKASNKGSSRLRAAVEKAAK
jgi:lipid-binding SYLF domain-containing protein